MKQTALILGAVALLTLAGCTQETQNKIGRSIQNWTGTNGMLEVYSGGKLMKRIMKIDKISTATETGGASSRAYRYGYGKLDANLNGQIDSDEKRVYFEFSDYSTQYLFYSDPE
ncbi:hypothetical protein JWG39_14825 [Desulforhopalus vacuolatus]|uniref:hypothetical protein n=1 Tax=Desulforhopalus vacuolatus TaxID=40414 RepID=UPI00196323F0|nr:hypothetical protein [Desulforhopalus vacuolatus]MBM9521093.1 hypothetical protein [Desulforhopalus vacuolatus]